MEEKIKVGGIMQSDGRAIVKLLSVPDRIDTPGLILGALGNNNVNIEFLVESTDLDGLANFTFCIDEGDLERAIAALETAKHEVDAEVVTYIPDVSVVSVFGPHFRERPRISGVMFSALASVSVNTLAISTSISSVSCVVESKNVDAAIDALYEAFDAPHRVKQRAKTY
jgi:aspartokinase